MRWDAKKKKYVRADVNDKKKIKTESGVWIPASYKSNRYAKWKERSKLAQMQVAARNADEEIDCHQDENTSNEEEELNRQTIDIIYRTLYSFSLIR